MAVTGNGNIEVKNPAVGNPAVDDDGDGNLENSKVSNTDKTFNVTE